MSYTIVQAPGGTATPVRFFSMHAPLWHVVSSSNVAQPDFRYILEVSVGGVTVATLKITPDPTTGQGRIDMSRVIRSFLTNYYGPRFSTAYAPFTMSTNAVAISYAVIYGEEYNGTTYTGLTADSYYAYNSYVGDTPASHEYEPTGSYQHGWLTDRDINNIRMPRNGRCFISYLNDPEENLRIRIQPVDDTGAPINPLLFYTSDIIMALDKLVVLNLNLEWINATPFTSAGTPAPIPTNAEGYRLAIIRQDGTTISDFITVRWLCEPKIPSTAIHFLNMHGGFDTFHFAGPTRKELGVDRTNYEKIGMATNAGIIREYDANLVYADTIVPFHSPHTWTRKLNSGFVDDQTHEWLWQLVASPQIYFESNGFSYPVTGKTQRWTQKIARFDRLYNLEMEVQMSRNIHSQNR